MALSLQREGETMKAKNKALLLGSCAGTPIRFYLWYQIMTYIGASELMWFLFWAYVPVTAITYILTAWDDS